MNEVTLLHPAWLAAAVLVALALLLRRRAGFPTVRFAPGRFVEGGLPFSWRRALAWTPRVLQIVAVLLIIAALARPVRRERIPLETAGIDILLCVDTSSSMSADDMDARRTRLAVAKDAAAEFVAGRTDDRVGLLAFARFPDVRCPPTLDHDALRAFLSEVTTVAENGPEDATGIGTAVARAAQVLSGSEAASRVVILLTDGEENVATGTSPSEIAPLHAAQLCERLGVRVYTIAAGVGAGDEIDTAPVERLSARTGGVFFAARDADAVARVYAEIDQLEKAALAEPRYRTEERFPVPLSAALVLLLVGRLLGASVLRVLP